jgi:hypothetical protein
MRQGDALKAGELNNTKYLVYHNKKSLFFFFIFVLFSHFQDNISTPCEQMNNIQLMKRPFDNCD